MRAYIQGPKLTQIRFYMKYVSFTCQIESLRGTHFFMFFVTLPHLATYIFLIFPWMNQNWVHESILAWLSTHFHQVFWIRWDEIWTHNLLNCDLSPLTTRPDFRPPNPSLTKIIEKVKNKTNLSALHSNENSFKCEVQFSTLLL
jgi:hypothetical protein